MSPQIKVTYFDGPGRAELTRLLLTVGGVQFEDERIQHAEFPALKATLPLGQLPVLTVDGVIYPQSMAMARYAARLAGLLPQDALESLKVDVISESLIDALNTMVDIMWRTSDETAKAEKTKKFVEEALPKIYGMIESQVQGKFVLGDKISLADVQLFDFTTNGLSNFKDFNVSAYPKVASIVEAVKANENVAAYLAKRQ